MARPLLWYFLPFNIFVSSGISLPPCPFSLTSWPFLPSVSLHLAPFFSPIRWTANRIPPLRPTRRQALVQFFLFLGRTFEVSKTRPPGRPRACVFMFMWASRSLVWASVSFVPSSGDTALPRQRSVDGAPKPRRSRWSFPVLRLLPSVAATRSLFWDFFSSRLFFFFSPGLSFYSSIHLYMLLSCFAASLSRGSFMWRRRLKLFAGSCCLWSRGLCKIHVIVQSGLLRDATHLSAVSAYKLSCSLQAS